MSKIHSGTITGTGGTEEISCRNASYSLTFSGGGTVAVQWKPNTSWLTLDTYTASTGGQNYTSNGVPMRFNCTSYSADITWEVVV